MHQPPARSPALHVFAPAPAWATYHPEAHGKALAARRAQRAAKEVALRARIDSLKDIDHKLTDWEQWKRLLAARKKELEAALVRIDGQLAQAAEEIMAACWCGRTPLMPWPSAANRPLTCRPATARFLTRGGVRLERLTA